MDQEIDRNYNIKTDRLKPSTKSSLQSKPIHIHNWKAYSILDKLTKTLQGDALRKCLSAIKKSDWALETSLLIHPKSLGMCS